MNNGSMPKKDNSSCLTSNDQTLFELANYRELQEEMLTDDDDDHELIESSEDEDEDDDDDDDDNDDDDDDDEDDDDENDEDDEVTFTSHTRHALLTGHHHGNDEIDLGLIDSDTREKLAAILQVTATGNGSIPDEYWRDPQVVRVLASTVPHNLNDLHELSTKTTMSNHQNSSSLTNNDQEKLSSTANDNSKKFVRACLNNDLRTVEKILRSTVSKSQLNGVNEDGESILALACSHGYTDLVRLLLAAIPEIDIDDRGSKHESTPLMEACNAGHYDIVEFLLKNNANVHIQSTSGNTALHYAAAGGYADIVQLLLQYGAKVHETNENGHTALMEAASSGHVEVARVLLAHGAGVYKNSNEEQDHSSECKHPRSDELHTALMEACMDGHVQVAKLLLDHGADVNMPPESYESPLTLSACGGHLELATLLIEHGANLEEVNDEGYTPLMEASREGHEDLVNLLVGRGADVNRTTEDTQETALTLACAGGFLDVVKILIDHGAKIDLGQSTPLMEASQEGHLELVQYLIKIGADVNQRSLSGDTALACACENDHEQVVQLLISAGAEVDHTDNEGRTALMKASRAGHVCTVRYLISQGANVNRTSSNNDASVLSLACAGGHSELASILLKYGANPNHLLKDRSNALIEAVKNGHISIVQLLLKYPKGFIQRTVNRTITNNNDNSSTNNSEKISTSNSTLKAARFPTSTSSIETNENSFQPEEKARKFENDSASETSYSTTKSGKKKRTTSSSSTSSSSSQNSLANTNCTNFSQNPLTLPVLSPKINFFSSSSCESDPSNNVNSRTMNKTHFPSTHHHSKLKKSFHRHFQKFDRRLDQRFNENPEQLEEINIQLKNLNFANSNDSTNETKMSINTDTQKALEHLRELANHPSTFERIQTLANHPNLIQEIKKIANQSFTEQLRTLPPFSPANLSSDVDSRTIKPDRITNVAQRTNLQEKVHQRFSNRLDVDGQTESNHDTALTLSCVAGHEDLTVLLLEHGANIEHRDKKGYTPLIIAAMAGHANVVSRLLEHNANIEAQAERSKDTALSLACSSGKQDVVEILLKKGANREHRNVSDYTALSLASSAGYVNIIRLLLNAGADINSRTGSKLGITPLMLASMSGHVAAVKLLLDMGADIHAQIETNRNTALTLACFQGRAEVVSLLIDRKANIEHRAKTGWTPLMESAMGGYVDVGRVLLERGADVNASPVPTSKDTALTIAAEKGREKFVELLLSHNATVDVRNKKGATPLWLASSNGHLEVVQLLVSCKADADANDSRKVSCLMAALRGGHQKVVKYLIRCVHQYPSDADCQRLISTITDKETLKNCQACMDQIIAVKERQAAEANKAANSLLEEISLEKSREQTRKVAAAKKREKRKAKKKDKQKASTNETEIETEIIDQSEENENVQIEQKEIILPVLNDDQTVSTSNLTEIEANEISQTVEVPLKSPSPVPTANSKIFNSTTTTKKKTSTMTRKIERYQENLVSKNKQHQQQHEAILPIVTVGPDDGWQEVSGKQKKLTIPHDQYERVFGRNGTNLKMLRDETGASIEIENKRAIEDKTILIKGNGDAIKHAYQLIMTLLKNSESDSLNLPPTMNEQKTKSRWTTNTHESVDNDEEITKSLRTNTTQKQINSENSTNDQPSASSLSTTTVRSMNSSKKIPSTKSNRSSSRSSLSKSTTKVSLPLTTTGATWINSNRINRTVSSSAGQSSNTQIFNSAWNSMSTGKNSTNNSNRNSSQTNLTKKIESSSSSNVSSLSTVATVQTVRVTPIISQYESVPVAISNTNDSSITTNNSSSLVVSPVTITNSSNTEEYNPFASNILTSSLVDVLTKPKDTGLSFDESNVNGSTKMNFAHVAKLHGSIKTSSVEPVMIRMEESVSPPTDPKIAPGYRGPSSNQNVNSSNLQQVPNYDTISPTGQLSRAPGANRRPPSVSPLISHHFLDQNSQNGSSTTSSSPCSSPALHQTPIGIHSQSYGNINTHLMYFRPQSQDFSHSENINTLRTNPTRMSHNSNQYLYHPVPQMAMNNNPTYVGMSSNLNPGAPEFQHIQRFHGCSPTIQTATVNPNLSLSSNFNLIPQLIEQKQHIPYQQAIYPAIRQNLTTTSEIETMHRLIGNQQNFSPHSTSILQIRNTQSSNGQLLTDIRPTTSTLNGQFQSNYLSQTSLGNNMMMPATVNTNVFETLKSMQNSTANRVDEMFMSSVNTINGQTIHPTVMINSNPLTGPQLLANDQKRFPGPIGSERKRQLPMSMDRTTFVKQPFSMDHYGQ